MYIGNIDDGQHHLPPPLTRWLSIHSGKRFLSAYYGQGSGKSVLTQTRQAFPCGVYSPVGVWGQGTSNPGITVQCGRALNGHGHRTRWKLQGPGVPHQRPHICLLTPLRFTRVKLYHLILYPCPRQGTWNSLSGYLDQQPSLFNTYWGQPLALTTCIMLHSHHPYLLFVNEGTQTCISHWGELMNGRMGI